MALALIDVDGIRIAQVVADGEDFPVAPPLQWVSVPNGTTTRHEWRGGAAVLPPDPPAPARASFPLSADELAAILISKGQLTQAEVDAEKGKRPE